MRKSSIIATAALVVIGAGLFLRLVVAMQPPASLVPVCLADDAFYYLRIAEHVLSGDGFTFDGRIATNGWHPLWMIISLIATAAAGGAMAASRLLLLLLAFIGAANAYLLWRIARRAAGEAAGLWAAAFWALNPYVLFTELMGVEAPLMFLFALLAIERWLIIRESDDATDKQWLLLGLFVGLAGLARTDAILLALPLAAAIISEQWRRGKIAPSLKAAAVSVVVVAPWLIFSLAQFGTVVQDSSRVLILRERLWLAAVGTPLSTKLVQQAQVGFADYFIRLFGMPNAALVFGLVGLLLGAMIVARLQHGVFWRKSERGLLPLLGWGALVWTFYLLYFWQQKYWYFLPVLATIALGQALVLGYLARTLAAGKGTRAIAIALGMLVLAGFASVGGKVWREGYQPWQSAYLDAAAIVRTMVAEEPDLKIGAMNAGILSAFSGLDVINLDGVVNPDAHDAIEDRMMLAYLRREGINVVVDHAKLIAAYGVFAEGNWAESFTLVHRVPASPFAGDVLVLRVKPPEASP